MTEVLVYISTPDGLVLEAFRVSGVEAESDLAAAIRETIEVEHEIEED